MTEWQCKRLYIHIPQDFDVILPTLFKQNHTISKDILLSWIQNGICFKFETKHVRIISEKLFYSMPSMHWSECILKQ